MPEYVEVKTQAQLDKALKRPGVVPVCVGDAGFVVSGSATVRADGSATVRAYGSATVRAYGSATVRAYGSATVRAYGSATVRADGSATVEAYGSATVEADGSATVRAYGSATVRAYGSATVEADGSATVRAYGSATVRAYGSATVEADGSATVEAYGSATVRADGSATVRAYGSATVEADGSATVQAYDSATVNATTFVAIQRHGATAKVKGGVLIQIPVLNTVDEWLAYYGVTVKRGIATLYKAVDDDYSTSNARLRGIFYTPGSKPSAPDWDPEPECGAGLHFSPRPMMAAQFDDNATRYVACPVKVAEIVYHGPDCSYPEKVKAPRVHGAIIEVDIDGEPVPLAGSDA